MALLRVTYGKVFTFRENLNVNVELGASTPSVIPSVVVTLNPCLNMLFLRKKRGVAPPLSLFIKSYCFFPKIVIGIEKPSSNFKII